MRGRSCCDRAAVELRGDADRLTAVLATVVAATLVLTAPMPNLPTMIGAFALAGIANSLFFAATLAARSEYAPVESRGQVFIWVGALKIAAGSAGTAMAGALIGGLSLLPVLLAAGLTAVVAVIGTIERARRPFRT